MTVRAHPAQVRHGRVARRAPPVDDGARMTTTTAPTPTVACPGGRAAVLVEEVVHDDPIGGEVVAQLLERADGERFVRLGYRRGGRVIRGPVSVPEAVWAALPKRLARSRR